MQMACEEDIPRFYFLFLKTIFSLIKLIKTSNMRQDNDTFIVQLTVGELIEILKEAFPILEQNLVQTNKKPVNDQPFSGRLVLD